MNGTVQASRQMEERRQERDPGIRLLRKLNSEAKILSNRLKVHDSPSLDSLILYPCRRHRLA